MANKSDQRLFNHDTQQWEDVSADQAPSLIGTGRYTYEEGVEIPVVTPEGVTGMIPSVNAFEAFTKHGYRPLTQADQNLDEERAKLQIEKDVYGNNPIQAAVQGAVGELTLGGSNVALNALGLAEGAKAIEEQNELASGLGKAGGLITGLVLSGGTSGVAQAAGTVGRGAAAARGIGQAAARTLGATEATALGRTAGRIAGEAAEGAFFGLGSGISEAALGQPDQVVDNLVSNMSMGTLLGGAAGSVFSGGTEIVKPGFDKLVSWTAKNVPDIVNAAARKVVEKGGTALAKAQGVEDAAGKMSNVIENIPRLQELYSKGGMNAVNAELNRLKPLVGAYDKEMGLLEKDIRNALKSLPKEAQETLSATLEQNGRNVYQAARSAETAIADSTANLRSLFASQVDAPITTNMSSVRQSIDDVIEALNSTKKPGPLKIAQDLQARRDFSKGLVSQADEANFMLDLVETLDPLLRTPNLPRQAAVRELFDMASDSLITHPNPMVSQTYGFYNSQKEALRSLQKLSDQSFTRILAGNKVFDANKAAKVLLNPESRATVEAVLNNFADLGPQFQQYQKLVNSPDILAKADLLQEIEGKIRPLVQGKVNTDEVFAVFNSIGKIRKIDEKITKLDAIREMFTPEMTLLDKAMVVRQALGQSTKDLRALSKDLQLLEDFKVVGEVTAPGISATRALIGGSIGGLEGILLGGGTTNLGNHIRSIMTLQKASETGAKLIEKGLHKATEALTSPTAAKVLTRPFTTNTEHMGIEKQREIYKESKKRLPEIQVGPGMDRAEVPGISQALTAQRNKVASFLSSKLPEDPLEGTSINPLKNKYLPPDYEVSKFYRYVRAADNPLATLEDIAEGKVSSEAVETLKTLYPRIYQDLQKQVMESIVKGDGDISYKQRLELGTIFDLPLDYSLQGDVIARLQFEINQTEGGRPEGTGGNKRISINIDPMESVATSTTLLSNKV